MAYFSRHTQSRRIVPSGAAPGSAVLPNALDAAQELTTWAVAFDGPRALSYQAQHSKIEPLSVLVLSVSLTALAAISLGALVRILGLA